LGYHAFLGPKAHKGRAAKIEKGSPVTGAAKIQKGSPVTRAAKIQKGSPVTRAALGR
jgi:hypothetical protein